MDFKFFLGVDISKKWFDCAFRRPDLSIVLEIRVDNNPDSIFSFLSDLESLHGIKISETLLVIEHTGLYVNHLQRAWYSKDGKLSMVAANKISRALENKESFSEKTDQIDARRISEYAIRFTDKLQLWQPRDKTIEALKALEAQRKRLIKAHIILTVPCKESTGFQSAYISEMMIEQQKQTVEALELNIIQIEQKMEELIQSDLQLKRMHKLMVSVCGVGKVTATRVLVTTEAFTKFRPDQAKPFARYNGIVPLPYQSGIKKKSSKISARADKKLKSMLTMGALSLINSKNELGAYYRRKIMENKEHNVVINAMRNKILLRIFAVVRNDIMYKNNFEYMLG